MSIHVMSLIWQSGLYSGSRLTVLLALGNFADDEGMNVFPSVATIGRYCRLDDRNVRRHYRALEADGVLCPVGPERAGPGRPRLYCIDIGKLGRCAALMEKRPGARRFDAAMSGRAGKNVPLLAAGNANVPSWNTKAEIGAPKGGHFGRFRNTRPGRRELRPGGQGRRPVTCASQTFK